MIEHPELLDHLKIAARELYDARVKLHRVRMVDPKNARLLRAIEFLDDSAESVRQAAYYLKKGETE